MSDSGDSRLKPADRAQICLRLALEIQHAIIAKDEARALEPACTLMSGSLEGVAAKADSRELEARAIAYGAVTNMLVHLVYADEVDGLFWETVMLPTPDGFMAHPLWVGSIKAARLFGAAICETPEIDVRVFSKLPLRQQAKWLGRYCCTHDATTPVRFRELAESVNPRLLPFLYCWLFGTYLQSPAKLECEDVTRHQSDALAQALAFRSENPGPLASSLMEINTPFRLSYREGFPVRQAAEVINGDLTRQLASNLLQSHLGKPSDTVRNALAGLEKHDAAIFCPNWREDHVAYRCLADLAEPMRLAGNPAIAVLPANASQGDMRVGRWAQQIMDVRLPGESPSAFEFAQVANGIRDAQLDFLFYPEVTPSNCTALLATQRLARVQAAGYGFPLTTGSPNMDYFIGGTEVESDGAEYREQLILLPGMGVSTTAPPTCPTLRIRPFDDERVRIVSLASDLKLNADLLGCWESILGDKPLALLDLFPSITAQQAEQYIPSMGAHLRKAAVDLHPYTDRNVILETLVDADLYLDSYPFGGFNSLVEVLVAGCPVVTLEGNTARQRFGAAMLRRLGLPEFLIAHSEAEYVSAARRLIDDPILRMDIRAQIGNRDRVLACLIDQDLPHHFAAAIEWMRQAGPRKSSPGQRNAPILIAAGEKPRLLATAC